MTPIISGLIGAVVATLLAVLSARTQRGAKIDSDGWKVLHPGWYLHFGFFGSAAFAVIMAYFFFVSTRTDADEQMLFVFLLMAVFGLAALYLGWTCYARIISFKNEWLNVRGIFGNERVYDLNEVSAVKEFSGLGEYRFTFRDGVKLRVSSYFHGVVELINQLPDSADTNFL